MSTGKTVAVIQSSYIPWKGYFDIIHDADLFIFYDDVQFTKQDWRSRNRVKSQQGSNWLTVPVGDRLDRLICDVPLENTRWASKHYKTLVQCYGRTPYWHEMQPLLEEVYLRRSWRTLSEFNQSVTRHVAREVLGIQTEFDDSRNWSPEGVKNERLLDLLTKVSATRYISGPAAQAYLDEASFARKSIELVYKDYTGYPEYPQACLPFDHHVTVFDLLCNVGVAQSPWYIWGWRSGCVER